MPPRWELDGNWLRTSGWADLGRLENITYSTSASTSTNWTTSLWDETTIGFGQPYTLSFNTTSSNTLWYYNGSWREDSPVRQEQYARDVEATVAASRHTETPRPERMRDDDYSLITHVAMDVREERRARADGRAQAIDRAEELLNTMLDATQRESWRLNGYFEVIGSHGTLYRLHRGTSGNVDWITPAGEVGGRLCAHPSMAEAWLPTPDVLLSQMLALRYDEREFVRIANVHAGTPPRIGVAA